MNRFLGVPLSFSAPHNWENYDFRHKRQTLRILPDCRERKCMRCFLWFCMHRDSRLLVVLGYTERMMSSADPHSSAEPTSGTEVSSDIAEREGWNQLEKLVDQLQELASSAISTQQFYRELLDGCVTLLAAAGGTVWLAESRGRWKAVHRAHAGSSPSGEDVADVDAQLALLRGVARAGHTSILQPQSSNELGENRTEFVVALAPVLSADGGPPAELDVKAIVELSLRPGSSPAVQQGWREFLDTIVMLASEFHLREQLRTLQSERGLYDQSLALVQRLQQTSQLRPLAYEIANEGRRFVGADRLSVVVKRGSDWKVLAASGVDRVEPRADVAKRLQELAAATSAWGEPVEYSDAAAENTADMPPTLAAGLEKTCRSIVGSPSRGDAC